MLEYFTLKKVKKHRAEKHAQEEHVQSPVLTEEDEHFLERIVSAEGTPPALPDRPHFLNREVLDSTNQDSQMIVHEEHEKDQKEREYNDSLKTGKNVSDKEKKKSKRFSFLHKSSKKSDDGLKPSTSVPPKEADKEEDDIHKVLDELNLAAVNNRAFSLSKESQVLVQKFTLVLKDLVNGVPTAYDDLIKLIEDSNKILSKNYENLPGFLKKLIMTLPQKLTSSMAPELLAAATEAQGLGAAATAGGLGGAAKWAFSPTNLKNLVTKPGAVAGMLRTIMSALKLRWPAFIGTNVLLSLGLFVLLSFFWYCHKRGREVRLEKEKVVDSNGRVTELEDDAMLGAPDAGAATTPSTTAPTAAAAAPEISQPTPVDTPILRDTGVHNGATSAYAAPTAGSEMHERK